MYSFIILTSVNGNRVYVNTQHITAVHEDFVPGKGNTVVHVDGDEETYFMVKESPEAVMNLIYGVTNK